MISVPDRPPDKPKKPPNPNARGNLTRAGAANELAGVSTRIPLDRGRLADFCRRHHIRRLSLFGSVLRDDFRPDSDVDVLVTFEPGRVIGLRIVDIENELSQLLGRRVDLVSEKYLNHRIRARVLASAEVQYVEG